MKQHIWIGCGVALLVSAFGACEPYLSREEALEDKSCAPGNRCAPGYTCTGTICVPDDIVMISVPSRPDNAGQSGGSAGADGLPAPGGAAGGNAAPAGGAGTGTGTGTMEQPPGGVGGMPGSAGAGSMEPGPSSGGRDPGASEPGADAGCTPVRLFRDSDGDRFGSNAPEDERLDCPPVDGFVAVSGDCNDAEPDVFPEQAEFFAVGYDTESGTSFDYDCDGSEEPGLDERFVPAPADCEIRTPNCGTAAVGYREPLTPREGAGVDPLCGSSDRVRCSAATTTTCALAPFAGERPTYTCR